MLKDLKARMKRHAERLEFEEAQRLKETVELVRDFAISSYIAAVRGLDYDVIAAFEGPYEQLGEYFIVIFSVYKGRVMRCEYCNFVPIHLDRHDLIGDFLVSFYNKENLPNEILVPVLPPNVEQLEALFYDMVERKVRVKVPKQGDKKKLMALAQTNLNLHVNRNRFDVVGKNIKEKLRLEHFPNEMECLDISHFSERHRVGAVVTFLKGAADRANYRNYLIKNAPPGDVYALKEVLVRRFKKKHNHPHLLVIDGGRAQLNVGKTVKKKLSLRSDIVALAKGEERIYLENGGSYVFPTGSPERSLFESMRDEAHRRAISYHRTLREKLP